MIRLAILLTGLAAAVVATRAGTQPALVMLAAAAGLLAAAAAWSPTFRAALAATGFRFPFRKKPDGGFSTKELTAAITFAEGLRGQIETVTSQGVVVVVAVVTDPETVNEWRNHAAAFGTAVGMATPAVTQTPTGVTLEFLPCGSRGRTPELTALKAWNATVPDVAPNLRRVPVARDAYGRPWHMPVLGSHALVIGATGAGKGSVLWSLVTQLAPGVRSGLVELWGIDPKSGIELGFGEDLFTRFIADSVDPATGESTWETDLADAISDARKAMSKRANAMRGKTRLHKPTVAEPLVVIIIDEYLALTIGVQNKLLAKQIDIDLKMLLTQGRAAGYAVIALAQLAQKNIIGIVRDLFPVRVMLRIPDKIQVSMVLGPESLSEGADAHKIPIDMPGTAYVLQDGQAEPRLVRFPWVPDEQVSEMARHYAPTRHQPPARAIEPAPVTTMPGPYERPVDAPTAPIPTTIPTPAPASLISPPRAPDGDVQDSVGKKSVADLIRETIAAHPHWDANQVAFAAEASARYVRKIMRADAG